VSQSGHYSPSQLHKTRVKITLLTLAIGSPKRASRLNRAMRPTAGLVKFGLIPAAWVARLQHFTPQLFPAGSFHIQGARL